MGNSCSCFTSLSNPIKEPNIGGNHFFSFFPPHLVLGTGGNGSWVPSAAGEFFSSQSTETATCEVVREEDGELKKTSLNLPHGAAANLCSLICQTYDLALVALHSRNTSLYLVKRLSTIQDAILDERLLLADGVLMLQAQELALEVGQMIKLFSCRGWLVRLNRPDIDDEVEFDRLVREINLLSEKCGVPVTIDTQDWESIRPASSTLRETVKNNGGLHNQIDKSEEDINAFVDQLLPGLSVDSQVAAHPVREEIRIAAAAEMPSAHTVIRHPDLRYIWWNHFTSEEVLWEHFWKYFPESLTMLEDASDAVGDMNVIQSFLQSPGARRQFRSAINFCKNSEYVLSIEIDSAFAPNKTIEESLAVLLDPMQDSPVNVQNQAHLLKESVLSSVFRVIRDTAGVPSEGTEIIGRDQEVGEICASIERGCNVVMITGEPGIGKTAVATTIADELLKGRIITKAQFINLCNIHELYDAIFRIGVSLKHPIYQSAISSENRLKNWLKRHGNLQHPTCWVLDGIDQLMIMPSSRIEFFELLTDILNFSPKLSLILTCSDAPDLSEIPCIEKIYQLDPLQEKDGFRLAESLLGGALSRGEARDLVSASDGFPLGIKIGGNGILSGGCSASHFTERLKRIRQDYSVPMRSKWNRCHDIIREGISSLPSEDKEGLILLTQCPDNFTVDHAAAVLNRSEKPTQTWSLLWRLMMRSFLRYIPSDGTYRLEEAVFDLVTVCTSAKSTETHHEPSSMSGDPNTLEIDEDLRDSARAGLVVHYLKLLDRALVIFRSGSHLSTYRLLEQECDGFDKFAAYLEQSTVRQKLLSLGHKGRLMKLLKILNDFLVDVGKHYFSWSQVKSICESVNNLWEEDPPVHYDEVSYKLRLSLANALSSIGERRDADIILNQMESYIDGLTACSSKDLKAKSNLYVIRAKMQHMIGCYPEAEKLFLQGLHAQQGAYGSEHLTVSRTYSLLAIIQQVLQKFEDAERSYKSSLKIRMKHSNKNVMEVPTVMHNWASLNQRLSKHADAETLYSKSLILREKYLGHKNVEVASSLVSLAAVKVSLQDVDEARDLYSRALSMLKDIVGEDHLAVSHTSIRLGVLLELQRNYEEAVQLFADALMIDLGVYGDQHEVVLKSIGRIQRVAFKHAQKLNSAGQLEMWKTYIEKLLSPFHYIWPEVQPTQKTTTSVGSAGGGQGLDTMVDLYGTTHSISGTIIPGGFQEKHQQSPNSETLSFRGFVQVNNMSGNSRNMSKKEDEHYHLVDRRTNNLDAHHQNNRAPSRLSFDSDGTNSVPSTPQMPILLRSHSASGPFFGDPPQPSSHVNDVSTENVEAIRKSTSYSDPQTSRQGEKPRIQTISIPPSYSSVHDNSHFGNEPGPSNIETSNSIAPRITSDGRVPVNALMTFTLEDDLLETTSLLPEQYDAIQSMIRNPLYRAEERIHLMSPSETPEPLINTYASFEL